MRYRIVGCLLMVLLAAVAAAQSPLMNNSPPGTNPTSVLLYNFVTNNDGLQTELLMANLDTKAGSCEVTLYQANRPAQKRETKMIQPGAIVSLRISADDMFQAEPVEGYMTASCYFKASGGVSIVGPDGRRDSYIALALK